MSTLVFLEHHARGLDRDALGVLSKAVSLGASKVSGVVVGTGVEGSAEEAGEFGASRVFLAEDPMLEAPLPQPRVDVLAQLVREQGFDTVLFAASVLAADVAGGLAARLGAGLNWDLVDVEVREERLVGKRPALADSVYADVGWRGEPRLAMFRAGSFEPRRVDGPAPELEQIGVGLNDFSLRTSMPEQARQESSGPSVEDADVVVAGGRGLGGREGVAEIEALARALGGVVGASRPVVDLGWCPFSAQIGQSGRTVSPKLYVACGISGAVQHKVGMRSAGFIISINKDRNAAIAGFSDLVVVGDVHRVVPKLTELVEARVDGAASG